jgi:hypothetical protein
VQVHAVNVKRMAAALALTALSEISRSRYSACVLRGSYKKTPACLSAFPVFVPSLSW